MIDDESIIIIKGKIMNNMTMTNNKGTKHYVTLCDDSMVKLTRNSNGLSGIGGTINISINGMTGLGLLMKLSTLCELDDEMYDLMVEHTKL